MAGFGLGISVPVQNTKEELIEIYFPVDIMIGEKSIKDFALEIHNALKDSGRWLPEAVAASEAVALPPPPGQAGAGGEQALPPPPPKAAAGGGETISCKMNDGNFQCYKKVNPSEIVVGAYSEAVKIETLLLENKDGKFSKEYAFFDIDGDNYTYLSILNEIVTHCYALYLLKTKCNESLQNVTIPNIISVSKKTPKEKGDAKIKIEMEHVPNLINAPKLLPNEKAAILANWEIYVAQIKTLLDCFETNNLFHNDTHIDNLTFSKNGDSFKLVLMDFGKATFKEQMHPSTTGFSKNDGGEEAKAKFERWLNGDFGSEFEQEFYGGKKSKTKHRKSKTKHSKTKRKSKKSKRKTKRTK